MSCKVAVYDIKFGKYILMVTLRTRLHLNLSVQRYLLCALYSSVLLGAVTGTFCHFPEYLKTNTRIEPSSRHDSLHSNP